GCGLCEARHMRRGMLVVMESSIRFGANYWVALRRKCHGQACVGFLLGCWIGIAQSPREEFMRQISRHVALSIVVLAAGIAVVDGDAAWRAARAQPIADLAADFIATNIPGASAISQVGTFLSGPPTPFGQYTLPHPIPTLFAPFILPGAVLHPDRILVGSRSNFGAELADGVGEVGSFLSINPSGRDLSVPPHFAQTGGQAAALGGAVQMFRANSPDFLNSVNNSGATTGNYPGVSNPLGLSNNNAFGRLWPANAPFFDTGVGSSSILDPTGLPLKG